MAEQYTENLSSQAQGEDRSIKEVLAELWQDSETLVRQELELAKVELEDKLSQAKADLTKAAVGGAVLYAGLLTLIGAVTLFVAKFVALWVAALLVAVVVIGVGYWMAQKGKYVKPGNLVPTRTIENVREDVHTLREAVK